MDDWTPTSILVITPVMRLTPQVIKEINPCSMYGWRPTLAKTLMAESMIVGMRKYFKIDLNSV
jgi:hypothetical protein